MKQTVIFDPDTGKVNTIYNGLHPVNGATSIDVDVPPHESVDHLRVVAGAIVVEKPAPVAPTEAEVFADAVAKQRTHAVAILNATDYKTHPDYDGSNKAEWRIYRQKIRDIARLGSIVADGEWPLPPQKSA